MRPSEYLHSITANAGAVASHIGELAGAEMKPAAKGLGIGAALFGGAGLFGYTALKILGFGVGFFFAWFFWKVAGLSPLFSLFLGFVLLFVFFLIGIVTMALIGRGQFKHVHAPTQTIDQVKVTLGSLGTAVADGVSDAENQLDAAKAAKAKPGPDAPRVNYVRDPVYLARQRRVSV